MNDNKKMGRPLKYGNESRVDAHVSLSQDAKTKIKLSGKPLAYFLEFGVNALLGDAEEKELYEIREELALIEPRFHELKVRELRIEERKKQKEELRRKKSNQEKYMLKAFREVISSQKRHGKVVVNMPWIEEAYGISFNLDKVNRDFQGAVEATDLIPEYGIEKYLIRKVQKGQREDKLMVEIIEADKEDVV